MRVVLVHGLWHGGWCWDAVREHLDAAGVSSAAADLPMTSLAADVWALEQMLDDLGEPVLLVGHSYGGAVITAAGAHPSVRGLVYLAAFALAETESISRVLVERSIPPTELARALVVSADGSEVAMEPVLGAALLYPGVPEVEVARSLALVRPVGRALFRGTPGSCAWRVKPTTYAVCEQDLVVSPELQRAMAARAGTVVSWPVGHACIQSDPELVSELLVGTVAALEAGSD
jgi:pimeloyl-ACP methyl ester carboxylesterase